MRRNVSASKERGKYGSFYVYIICDRFETWSQFTVIMNHMWPVSLCFTVDVYDKRAVMYKHKEKSWELLICVPSGCVVNSTWLTGSSSAEPSDEHIYRMKRSIGSRCLLRFSNIWLEYRRHSWAFHTGHLPRAILIVSDEIHITVIYPDASLQTVLESFSL